MRTDGNAGRVTKAWASGDYFGDNKPTARATIRPGNFRLTPAGDYGDLASILFSFTRGDAGNDPMMTPVELPNIKSVEWARDVDNDVAECTITMYNTWDDDDGSITPGYFTWNRGDTPYDGGIVATETTTPLIGSVRGGVPSAIHTESVRGGTALQPFAPAGAASVQVKQIKLTLPAGAAGRYDVGIQDAGKGVVATNSSARKWVPNALVSNVQLNVGDNYVTFPLAVTLSGAGGPNPHTYHLILKRRDGATFNVNATNGDGQHFALNIGAPSYASRSSAGKLIYDVSTKPPMCFELIGPTITRKIGRRNEWYGKLVPDNVIQVFEGYGADYSVCPEHDPNLMLTGTWLIDDVTMQGGMITLSCRDFGRILLDQILFPPITPRTSKIEGFAYPISFAKRTKNAPAYTLTSNRVSFRTSSNAPYVGNNSVRGHSPSHGCDGNNATYWLSIGNQRNNDGYSFEYFEVNVPNTTINEAHVYVKGGPYRAYVSVFSNGHWVNDRGIIPYDPNNPVSAPNGANIPYCGMTTAPSDGVARFKFGKNYPKVTRVRFTFTNLWNSGFGPFPYRAAVREVSVFSPKAVDTGYDGNYDDYTDIVKLLLAWGGFHWPRSRPFVAISDGTWFELKARPADDPALGKSNGRIYGDLENTGGYGPSKLEIPNFDKKSIMDAIQSIRDIVGFIFYVDHGGGAIWRAPNYHDRGNKVNGQRVNLFTRILDTQTMQDISVKLSGRDVRERFYVATPNGEIAAGARGWNLNPIGLRRVAGWTDVNFDDTNGGGQAQAQTMAQLLAMHTMMRYRTTSVTIAGNPTIEPDDQVELVDAVTGEGYIHYVRGVKSQLDHSSGEYTFMLDTNWLGTKPGDDWFIDKYGKLNDNLQNLLDFTDRGRSDGAYDKFGRVVS